MSKVAMPKQAKLVDLEGKPMEEPAVEAVMSAPEPKGWRILIAIPEVEAITAGGIHKADITRDIEQTSTVVGLVLKLGNMCYSDEARFGPEPWCKVGDYVLIGAYKGVRFRTPDGTEFRFINDDTVQGTVEDPRGYTRA
jgi:co-chaperonin GroES (HSP10)